MKIEKQKKPNYGLVESVVCLCLALFLAGCCTTAPQVQREHVIVVNNQGQSLYPEYNDTNHLAKKMFLQPESTNDFQEHIAAIINGIASSSNQLVKLLIFIHGGLNSYCDGMSNATNDIPQIEANGYYPLFICWDSSLWSSYGEHLVSIRQGVRVNPLTGWLTSLANAHDSKERAHWLGMCGAMVSAFCRTLPSADKGVNPEAEWHYDHWSADEDIFKIVARRLFECEPAERRKLWEPIIGMFCFTARWLRKTSSGDL